MLAIHDRHIMDTLRIHALISIADTLRIQIEISCTEIFRIHEDKFVDTCGYILHTRCHLRILADTYYILGVIPHVSAGRIHMYMNVSAKVYPDIRTRILMYTKSISNVYTNGNILFLPVYTG